MKIEITNTEIEAAWDKILTILGEYCGAEYPNDSVMIIKKVLDEMEKNG